MKDSAVDPLRLLKQARAGDEAALGRLLELYRNYLSILARIKAGQQLKGKADTSDFVQEAFMEAHRDFGQFRGKSEGELLGWLRQILARNLANQVRRYYGTQQRDLRLERRLQSELDQSSRTLGGNLQANTETPSRIAAKREQAVLLANALARLPDDYRDVIILRHLERLRFPKVARRMNRSLDSVEKLWTRALVRFRKALGEQP